MESRARAVYDMFSFVSVASSHAEYSSRKILMARPCFFDYSDNLPYTARVPSTPDHDIGQSLSQSESGNGDHHTLLLFCDAQAK